MTTASKTAAGQQFTDGMVHFFGDGGRSNSRAMRDLLGMTPPTWIVPAPNAPDVEALLEREYRATRLHSSGGFLRQSNATVLVGVEDGRVDDVVGIVRESCRARTQVVNPMPPLMEPGEFFMPYPLEVEVGGATVFVLPVERFERL